MFNVLSFIAVVLGTLYTSIPVYAESLEQPSSAETFATFIKYAEFAAAAYKSVESLERVSQHYEFQFTHQGANTIDKVRYFIATNDHEKSHIIAVRGTSNVENAIVDIDYVLTPDEILGIELHKGFAQSALNIYEELKSKLNKDYTIHITGHSLGGAVAVILGMYLDNHGYNTGNIITFGQPKITNRLGAKAYKHLKVIRVNNLKDMVSTVPPFDASQIMDLKFSIFWHLGKEYVLLSSEYYSVLDGLDSLMRGADFLTQTPSVENITAHKIDTYIEQLKSLNNQGKEIPYNERDKHLKPDISPPVTQSI